VLAAVHGDPVGDGIASDQADQDREDGQVQGPEKDLEEQGIEELWVGLDRNSQSTAGLSTTQVRATG